MLALSLLLIFDDSPVAWSRKLPVDTSLLIKCCNVPHSLKRGHTFHHCTSTARWAFRQHCVIKFLKLLLSFRHRIQTIVAATFQIDKLLVVHICPHWWRFGHFSRVSLRLTAHHFLAVERVWRCRVWLSTWRRHDQFRFRAWFRFRFLAATCCRTSQITLFPPSLLHLICRAKLKIQRARPSLF